MTTTLDISQVPGAVRDLLEWRRGESSRLERIYLYLRDPDAEASAVGLTGNLTNGPLRWLKSSVSPEVKRLAELSRVNMLKFVVSATTQVMYVDGFRARDSSDEEPAWDVWQRNKMDARQIGVHRSALSYGVSYVTVLPGTPVPVIRGASPRKMTAVYGDDDDWPELALEQRRSAKKNTTLFRVYDAMNTWWVEQSEKDELSIIDVQGHDIGHCPVVRFVSNINDDGIIEGEVEPLIPLQDQINVTTFGLQVAQHYAAFRQRYILGWTAPDEAAALTASAKKLWTFEDAEVKVGEFSQTDLSGYINSREASLRHLATISQTPAHELLGQLVNLSAEALAAAEANHQRKVTERQTSFGEGWEQVLELAADIQLQMTDPTAAVRWRDTEARALSSVADALGKLAAQLGVPKRALWEKIPGVTQDDIARWIAMADEEKAVDPMSQLAATLSAQGATDGGRANGPIPPAAATA